MSTPTAKSEYAKSIFLECKLEEAIRDRDALILVGKVVAVAITIAAWGIFFFLVSR